MIPTLPRLTVGMLVLFEGQVQRVVKVNDCCARIVPVEKRVKVIVPATGKNAGQRLTIAVQERGCNISPESEIPILEGARQ